MGVVLMVTVLDRDQGRAARLYTSFGVLYCHGQVLGMRLRQSGLAFTDMSACGSAPLSQS